MSQLHDTLTCDKFVTTPTPMPMPMPSVGHTTPNSANPKIIIIIIINSVTKKPQVLGLSTTHVRKPCA